MNRVIVDTSVWSLFLRRKKAPSEEAALVLLRRLIREKRVQMLGVVRQELLTGIRHEEQFESLKRRLEPFPDLLATSADHVMAARFFNTCRRHGTQGSFVDFLICAQSVSGRLPILAGDADFNQYARFIPIVIHPAGVGSQAT